MKNSKLKTLVKSARKNAEKEIKSNLIAGINDIVSQHGELSKRNIKDIRKGAKTLSRKIARSMKIDKTAIQQSETLPTDTETTNV